MASLLQKVLTGTSVVLIGLLLLGLFRTRLYRICYSFVAYLLAVFTGEVLILLAPDTFYVLRFWHAKEALYALLKLAVALDLSAFVFQAFPGARHRARQVTSAVVVLAVVAVGFAVNVGLPGDPDHLGVEIQARVNNSAALLFAAVGALILWYRIPLHWLHQAILRGFLAYLVVFALLLQSLRALEWAYLAQTSLLAGIAYVLVIAYWTWAVWRPKPAQEEPPGILMQLQPWRNRL